MVPCRASGWSGDAPGELPAGAAGQGQEANPGAGQGGEEATQEETGQKYYQAQEDEGSRRQKGGKQSDLNIWTKGLKNCIHFLKGQGHEI